MGIPANFLSGLLIKTAGNEHERLVWPLAWLWLGSGTVCADYLVSRRLKRSMVLCKSPFLYKAQLCRQLEAGHPRDRMLRL